MNTRWWVLAFVLLASPAWANEHYTQVLQDQNGHAITNASVSVYLSGTTTLATIFSNSSGTSKANPFKTETGTNGAPGLISFYAADGLYDLVFSKVGYSFTAADTVAIALFDPTGGGGGGGSGGVSTFDQLGSGTNTTATMTVGAGALFTYSSTGIINASLFKGNSTVAVSDGGTGLTGATSSTTMVGNGASWIATALPSCSNATTSKLLFNNSTLAFSCGTDQSSGGGTTYDAIGSGTNTGSAFVMGSGGTLTPSGTGVIEYTAGRPNVTTINSGNSPYTALTTDHLLLCDTAGGARIITLPAATSKQIYKIKNIGSNTCTINRAGADTIDGGTSAVLNFQYESIAIVSDATSDWKVF